MLFKKNLIFSLFRIIIFIFILFSFSYCESLPIENKINEDLLNSKIKDESSFYTFLNSKNNLLGISLFFCFIGGFFIITTGNLSYFVDNMGILLNLISNSDLNLFYINEVLNQLKEIEKSIHVHDIKGAEVLITNLLNEVISKYENNVINKSTFDCILSIIEQAKK